MANTAEKIKKNNQESPQKTIEQWLHEDVVPICHTIMADPSSGCISSKEAIVAAKERLKAKHG